jgi:hypothetical protein
MRARMVAAALLAIQGIALVVWTISQANVIDTYVNDARQPGAENFTLSIVIASGFGIALFIATVMNILVLVRNRLDIDVLMRLELGVMGLGIVAAIATQGQVSVPLVVSFVAAALVATLTFRARLS